MLVMLRLPSWLVLLLKPRSVTAHSMLFLAMFCMKIVSTEPLQRSEPTYFFIRFFVMADGLRKRQPFLYQETLSVLN